jgi:hypothetical protein
MLLTAACNRSTRQLSITMMFPHMLVTIRALPDPFHQAQDLLRCYGCESASHVVFAVQRTPLCHSCRLSCIARSAQYSV